MMNDPLTTVPGTTDVASAVAALSDALSRRGIPLFAVIDHAENARAIHLDMNDETVVIFGNPAVGTPLMQADPRVGIDLPLRMLIWRDEAGTAQIGYEDPHRLAAKFDVASDAPQLDGMAALLATLAADAAAPVR